MTDSEQTIEEQVPEESGAPERRSATAGSQAPRSGARPTASWRTDADVSR